LVTNFDGAVARNLASNLAVLSVTTGGTTSTTTQVLYAGGTYTQNFDTLPNSGTFSLTGPGPINLAAAPINASGLGGWSFASVAIPGTGAFSSGALGSATALFNVGTNLTSQNQGAIYSYGAMGGSDRTLGVLLSGTTASSFGVALVNNTPLPISQFTVAFTGEQWRFGNGGGGGIDKLAFQYRIGGSDIVTGTFTTVPAL